MTMHVRLPNTVTPLPNRALRSTTGTTEPRRLMTPRRNDGIIGTVVTWLYSMISRTLSVLTVHFLSSQEGQVLQGFIDLQRWLVSA